jgi:hypothetical protein
VSEKSKEEAELEAKIARKILEKNPKLREAGYDTSWIVERQAVARKGQKAVPAGGIDATDLDSARDAYEERIAKLEAEIQTIKRTMEESRHATRIMVEKWVSETNKKVADKTKVKQALQLRKTFLDTIGFKST